jgi:hypothetical protein
LLGLQRKDGHLPWGILTKEEEKFQVHRHIMEKIWQRGKSSLQEGSFLLNMDPKNVGPKEKPYFLNI